jgi:hypothetical protein
VHIPVTSSDHCFKDISHPRQNTTSFQSAVPFLPCFTVLQQPI